MSENDTAKIARMEGLGRVASRLSHEVLTLRTRVAELEAALAEKTGEAERQYDYNVSQIARVAKLERALKDIAKQKLDGEMDDDGPWGSIARLVADPHADARAEVQGLLVEHGRLTLELIATRARVAKLEAALEPFARNVNAISLREALGHIEREHLLDARTVLKDAPQ